MTKKTECTSEQSSIDSVRASFEEWRKGAYVGGGSSGSESTSWAAYQAGLEAGKPKWISVKDDLPDYIYDKDYSENVLGFCDGSMGVFARCYEEEGWLWGSCYGDIEGEPQTDDDYQVTHWMPLPEPPKE